MAAFDFPTSPATGDRYEANGVSYIWNGVAWLGEGGTSPLSNKVRVIQYPNAGTFNYVPASNVKAVQVELFGSGGGSGGAAVTAATTTSAGGGGGGGGYTRKLYNRADLAASETLVIGSGGAGGDGISTNGQAGTTSTFKGLSVTAGGGGPHSIAATAAGSSGRGGPGVGSGGDFNGQGNSGMFGLRNSPVSGQVQAGYGGAGYGKAQFFNAPVVSTSVPSDAVAGGGANGAANGFTQTLTPGARGGDGYATITEYYYDSDEIDLPDLEMKVTTVVVPGTTAYVKPAGLKFLEVELWGGGGSGQGTAAITASQLAASGGGGGGGYCKKLYKADELNASETLVVGAGGVGSTTVAGGHGEATTFKQMAAGGGTNNGSVPQVGQASATFGWTIRAGGAAASGGDVNLTGGDGDAGFVWSSVALGGSGGQSPYGGSRRTSRPAGGSSIYGTYGGLFPGGGGTGVGASNTQSAAAGGTGGGGMAVLTEYFVDIPSVSTEEIWFDWAPQLRFAGNTVGLVQAASTKGRGRKRGKKVDLWFDIQLTAKGTSTGSATIAGMPDAASNAISMLFSGSMAYTTGMTAGQAIFSCYMAGSVITLTNITVPATGTAFNTASDASFSNTSRIIGSVSYEAA